MPVIEGRNQTDVFREQHAVAEDVAAHIADTGDGEVLGLGIDAHLSEMPPDRFPRPLGRDAHHFVVVAHRTTRCECVTQPESVRVRHLVGDIGERGGALIRGDDEVGVIAVPTHHIRRCHHLAAGPIDVVGDVEQAGDEQSVTLHAFVAERIPIDGSVAGGRRRVLHHEAAFGSDGNDDGILDRLRLHQTQDFGAEVLAAVAPAQSTAGHRTESQMHAFNPG